MSEREIAIKAVGVKKKYRLGAIGGTTLKAEVQSWWARKLGREDPNLRIGFDQNIIGREFWALNGVDLTVYRGERIGIIGLNGAGKSTLLKILSRITAPTEGEVDIWGRISSLLEIGTGFHPELTGRENVYMNGAILGMSRAEIDSKMNEIIEFSEIETFIDTPVKRYSSGMFVKLAFAVAAFLDSEILVMDEVLAVGDMAFQKKCLDKMRRSADEEGKTILYVSHNMDTIRRLCERCVVLDHGKVVFDGDVEEAIAIYMNSNIEENPVDISLEGKDINLLEDVRMEHLLLRDKVTPVYSSDEGLNLLLTVKTSKPISNATLRLTFRTETDVAIGTAWSQPFNLTDAGTWDLSFSFPMEQIAKGRLFVSLGIYKSDELGYKMLLSHVTRAFLVEVRGLPIWGTSSHGYISLDEIQVLGIEQK